MKAESNVFKTTARVLAVLTFVSTVALSCARKNDHDLPRGPETAQDSLSAYPDDRDSILQSSDTTRQY